MCSRRRFLQIQFIFSTEKEKKKDFTTIDSPDYSCILNLIVYTRVQLCVYTHLCTKFSSIFLSVKVRVRLLSRCWTRTASLQGIHPIVALEKQLLIMIGNLA